MPSALCLAKNADMLDDINVIIYMQKVNLARYSPPNFANQTSFVSTLIFPMNATLFLTLSVAVHIKIIYFVSI